MLTRADGGSGRRAKCPKWPAAVMVGLLAGACAGPNLPSLSQANHGYGASETERKLIADSRRLNDELERKGLLLEQAELVAYLKRVGQRVVAAGAATVQGPRFMVMRTPQVNAFALPNGDIYLTAGLLAQLHNESQLAMVLAHEYAHVELRHALRAYETRRSSIMAAHIADLFLMGTSLAYLPALAAVSGYSREQEGEADRVALERLLAAGYDGEAALGVFELLAALDQDDERGAWVFRSHPMHRERIEVLRASLGKAAGRPSTASAGGEDFVMARRSLLRESASLALRAARPQFAYEIGASAGLAFPDRAWPLAIQGEARRMMAENPRAAADESVRKTGKPAEATVVESFEKRRDEHIGEAERLFGEALRLEPGDPEAERGLGLVRWMRGDIEAARALLERYLERRPNAPDRLYIANLLKKGKSR